MEKKQKTYVPKSKAKRQQTSFGDVLKLGFEAKTLIQFIHDNTNAAGYINFDIVPRRETDQYGNTHSVVLNDWVPDASRERKPLATTPGQPKQPYGFSPRDEDVPF